MPSILNPDGDPVPVHKWTLERTMFVLTFVFSAVACVFGLGVQWQRTIAVEAEIKATRNLIESSLVRKDVYDSDQRRLSEAIDRLTAEISRVVNERGAVGSTRMFDR
jgi:hypothetical protein